MTPGLVLLHGLGLSRRSWDPIVPRLAERAELLALDLPGFGDAPALDGEPTVAALADAVQAQLDRAGVGDVTAVGNSLGGSIALELARRGRVARVVVLGPAGLEAPAERYGVIALNETQRAAYVAAAPVAGLVAANPVARTVLLGWLHGQPWRMPVRVAEDEIRDFAGAPGFHATLRRATSCWRPSDLAAVEVPVRICVGTRDVLIGAPNARRFAAALPDAHVVPLPGCGHVPMADDPGGVANAIGAFAAP
jgi:pimeloyl-ACP methyl ester carboxylesterase